MGSDTDIILAAFNFVCGENIQSCRLCFASPSGKQFNIEDSACIKRRYMNETVTFHDMLDSLGAPTDITLPKKLCSECAATIIHSYSFKKLSQYSNEAWNQALVQLEETLDETQFISETMKTAFLTINQNDEKVIYTSRIKVSRKSKLEVLRKFKAIKKDRRNYTRQKIEQNKELICEECGEQSSSKMALRHHMQNHKKHQCPHCFKALLSEKSLQFHMERSHYPKKLQCDKCSKMFSHMKFLKTHLSSYHVTRTCNICLEKFPTIHALRHHKDTHRLIKCPRCNKVFKKKSNLYNHVKICGVETELSFFCDICSKGYVRKGSLKSHLKIEHGFGKVLKCSCCDKKFESISLLKSHMIKHTRERNFFCEQCGGKFITKMALLNHTRRHTGERPFPCDLCDERFLSTSRRMEHKRRKHFAPTKECAICQAKFTTKHELVKHFKRHSNPKSKLYVPFSETNEFSCSVQIDRVRNKRKINKENN